MTCVVAVTQGGRVYMGADKQGSGGGTKRNLRNPKIFNKGNFIIGYTSSYRMGQILQYVFQPPEDTLEDTLRYMVSLFIPEVRKCFKDEGFSWECEGDNGGTFIVGYKGEIYTIFDDFQVSSPNDTFTAVGSGFRFALGNMYNSRYNSPEDIIKSALQAASNFDCYVGSDYEILEGGLNEF